MKKLFYLLILSMAVAACNDDFENVSDLNTQEEIQTNELAVIAKKNIQNTTNQKAYVSSQLKGITLSGIDLDKTYENSNHSYDNSTDQAKFYNNLGNDYYGAKQYDLALYYYFSALQLKIGEGNSESIALTFRNIGLAYQSNGEYENAAVSFWQAYFLWESIGSVARKAQTLNDLGAVYDLAHDFSQNPNLDVEDSYSLYYYENALALNESLSDGEGIVQVENNISLLFSNWLAKDTGTTSVDKDKDLSRDQDDVEDEL